MMIDEEGDKPAQHAICSGVRHNLSVSSTLQESMIERAAKNKRVKKANHKK